MKEEKAGCTNSQNKKAQFYIISAVVIIFIIIGFAVVTNYVSVREKPEQFYDIGEILKLEGVRIVEYAEYNEALGTNVEAQIESYVRMFRAYTIDNPNETFSFIIIYGSITGGKVKALNYSTESGGGLRFSLGQTGFQPDIPNSVYPEQIKLRVNEDNTVNITLTGGIGEDRREVVTQVPVFPDNNFAFVMTTSKGFNDYIQSSLETQ